MTRPAARGARRRPPRRASRRWRSSWPDAIPDLELRVGRLDAGVPGHGHRHGQADAGRAGRGAAPPDRRRRPVARTAPSRGSRREAAAALADIEARGRRALLVGGTGAVPAGGGRRPRDPRPVPRGPRPSSRPSPTPPRCTAGCAELDPVAAGRMEPTNRRRVVRALEVTLGSGRPFSCFGPGLDDLPADAASRSSASAGRARTSGARIEARYADADGGRLPRRGPGAALADPRRLSRTAARPSATRSCSPTSRAGLARRGGRPGRAPHPPVRPAPGALVPPRPRITWLDVGDGAENPHARATRLAGLRRLTGACASPSTTAWATTSSSLLDLANRHPVDPPTWPSRCATGAPASAPTG